MSTINVNSEWTGLSVGTPVYEEETAHIIGTDAFAEIAQETIDASVDYAGTVSITDDYAAKEIAGDLFALTTADMSEIMVNAAWIDKKVGDTVEVGGKSYKIGTNAFSTATEALAAQNEEPIKIEILSDTVDTVTSSGPLFTTLNDMVISADTAKTLRFTGDDIVFDTTAAAGKPVLTIDKNISITSDKVVYLGYYYAPDFVVNGSISGTQIWIGALTSGDAKVTVSETGRLASTGEAFITRYGASLTVNGNAAVGLEEAARTLQMDANYSIFHSGTIAFNDTYVKSGPISLGTGTSLDANYNTSMTLSNSILRGTGALSNKETANPKTSVVTLKNHSQAFFTAVTNRALIEMYDSTLTVTGKVNTSDSLILSGESKLSAKDIVNSASLKMSYSSQIAFSGTFSNTGTITVDTTGIADAAAGYYKLLDYTGSGTYTVNDYKTLFGSNWNNDFCVMQNDLFVANASLDVVYVGTENKIIDVGGKPYYMTTSLTDALAIVEKGGNIIIQDKTKSYRFEDLINTKNVKISTDLALNITTDGSTRTFDLENAKRGDLYSLYQIKKNSATAFVFDDFNDKITFNLTNPNDYYFSAIIGNPAASPQNSGTDVIFNTFSGSITMNAVAASDKVPIQLYVSGISANKGPVKLGNFTGSINTDLVFNSVATKDSAGIQAYGIRAGGLITVGNVFSGTIKSALHSTTVSKPNLVTSHGLASVDGLNAGIKFDNTVMTGKIISSADGDVGKGNYNSYGITYGIYSLAAPISGTLTMKSGAQILALSSTNRFAKATAFDVKEWNLNLTIEEGAVISADAFSSTNSTTTAYGIYAKQMAGSIVVEGTLSGTASERIPNTEEFPGDPGFPSSAHAIYAEELFSTTQTITIGNTSMGSTAKAVMKGDVYIGAGNSTNQNKGTMNLVGRSDITGNFEITDYTVNFKSGYTNSTFTGFISAYAINLESNVSATVSDHIYLTDTITLASGSTLNLTLDTEDAVLSVKGFSVSGSIVIDTTGAVDEKYLVINNTGSTTFDYSKVTFTGNDRYQFIENGDLYAIKAINTKEQFFVDSAWTGKANGEAVKIGDKYYVFGTNAFATMEKAIEGQTAFEDPLVINISGQVGAINGVGSVTEINKKKKVESGVINQDAYVLNLTNIDNANAGWQVLYPLASGSATNVSGNIVVNLNSNNITSDSSVTGDSNIIGGGYSGYTGTVFGNTTLNLGVAQADDAALTIKTKYLIGSGAGTVNGNSSVVINSGTFTLSRGIVGGSAWNGTVAGTSSVVINGGTIDINESNTNAILGGALANSGFPDSSVGGASSVIINGGSISGADIYGGGKYANTTANSSVTINGGTINNNTFGGGFVYAGGQSADVGNTSVTMTNGSVYGRIAGGGTAIFDNKYYQSINPASSSTHQKVTFTANSGYSTIRIDGGTVAGILGGGLADQQTGSNADCVVSVKDVSIQVKGGSVTKALYGGGVAIIGAKTTDYAWDNQVKSTAGNVEIILNGGTFNRSIFGGGYAYVDSFDPTTSVTVSVKDVTLTINGAVFAPSANDDGIYGGGRIYISPNGNEGTALNTVGNVTINIQSAVDRNVYGGSYIERGTSTVTTLTAEVASSVINISADVNGNIYAGGRGSGAVTNGNATINISGGAIAGGVYAGGADSAVVNGTKTLNFTNNSAYTFTGAEISGFDSVNLKGAELTLKGTTFSTELTFAGTGKQLTLSGVTTTNKITVDGATLTVTDGSSLAALNGTNGAALIYVSGTIGSDIVGFSSVTIDAALTIQTSSSLTFTDGNNTLTVNKSFVVDGKLDFGSGQDTLILNNATVTLGAANSGSGAGATGLTGLETISGTGTVYINDNTVTAAEWIAAWKNAGNTIDDTITIRTLKTDDDKDVNVVTPSSGTINFIKNDTTAEHAVISSVNEATAVSVNVTDPSSVSTSNSMEVRGNIVSTSDTVTLNNSAENSNLTVSGSIQAGTDVKISQTTDNSKVEVLGEVTGQSVTISHESNAGTNTNILLEKIEGTDKVEMTLTGNDNVVKNEIAATGTNANVSLTLADSAVLSAGKKDGEEKAVEIKAKDTVTIINDGHLNANITANTLIISGNTSHNTLTGNWEAVDIQISGNTGTIKDSTIGKAGTTNTISVASSTGGFIRNSTMTAAISISLADFGTLDNTSLETAALTIGTGTATGTKSVLLFKANSEVNGDLLLTSGAVLRGSPAKMLTNNGSIAVSDATLEAALILNTGKNIAISGNSTVKAIVDGGNVSFTNAVIGANSAFDGRGATISVSGVLTVNKLSAFQFTAISSPGAEFTLNDASAGLALGALTLNKLNLTISGANNTATNCITVDALTTTALNFNIAEGSLGSDLNAVYTLVRSNGSFAVNTYTVNGKALGNGGTFTLGTTKYVLTADPTGTVSATVAQVEGPAINSVTFNQTAQTYGFTVDVSATGGNGKLAYEFINLPTFITVTSTGKNNPIKFTLNDNTQQAFDLVLKVTDETGLSAQKTVSFNVTDYTAPVFTEAVTVKQGVDNYSFTITAKATDNFDGENVTFEYRFAKTADMKNALSISDNAFTLGELDATKEYYIQARAFDKAGNVSAWTDKVKVTVADVTKPVVLSATASQVPKEQAFTFAVADTDNVKVTARMFRWALTEAELENAAFVTLDKTTKLLLPDTVQTFCFQTKSIDAAGNETISDVQNKNVRDYVAPVFQGSLSVAQDEGYSFTVTAKATDNFDGENVTYVYLLADNSAMKNATTFGESAFLLDASNAAKTYYIQVSAFDAAGNVKKSETVVFTVADVTAPVIESVSATQGSSDYTFEFAVRDSDNVGVTARNFRWAETQEGLANAEITVLGDLVLPTNTIQNFFYQIQSVDAAGNATWSDAQSVTVKDVTAPEFQSTVSVAQGEGYSFTVTAKATDNFDGENVTYVYLLADNSAMKNATTLGESAFLLDASNAAKTYYIQVSAFDAAGNVKKSETVVFTVADVTAPVIESVSATQGSSDYTFEFAVRDSDNVGVTARNFRWAETQKGLENAEITVLGDLVLPTNTIQNFFYQIQSVDAAGNATWSDAQSVTVKDVTAPIFESLAVDQTGKTYGFSITADATDNFDGKDAVLTYYISADQKSWTKLDGTTFQLDEKSVGKNYYVKVDAADRAGNTASQVVTVTPKDVTDPELLTYKVAQQLRSYLFTFSATGSDNSTPAEELKFFYRWGTSSAELAGDGVQTTEQLVLNADYANTTLYYQVRAMDAAGNTSAWSSAAAFTVAKEAGSSADTAVNVTGEQVFFDNRAFIYVDDVAITQDSKTVFYAVDNLRASETSIMIDGLQSGEKIKIRLMNADGKVLKTVSASAGSNGKALVKDLLTEAGTMFVSLESASKKTNNTSIMLDIENVYFEAPTENNDFATAFALEQNPLLAKDSTVLFSDVSGWVGFGDAVDTYKFTADYARSLTIGLTSTETKVKFSVYNALGKRLASYSANEKTSVDKFEKNLLLDSGTYFIKVESEDKGKGKYNGAFNFTATETVFDKITNDSLLNPTSYNPETGANGWVGYSDAADFYKFEIALDGKVSFNLTGAEEGIKIGSQLKIALYSMETGKKLSIKSVKNDDSMNFISSKSLAAGSYCAVVMTSNEKKYMSSYSLNIAS